MTRHDARGARRPHVLMIGNNAAPSDRRLWLECLALHEAGCDVSVVCPRGRESADDRSSEPMHEVVGGVHIHRYRRPGRSGGRSSLMSSFVISWLHTLRLTWGVWRRRRFDLIQACNPPDTFFLIARLFRPFGVRFVFDQHDLSPEIFRDRFGDGSDRLYRQLRRFERATHRHADHVITVNESCRSLLLSRTDTRPDRLTVVRTGPDLARLHRSDPDPELRQGFAYLCAYLGVMGPQDGVELILYAVRELVHEQGRDDIRFVLMGDGECLDELTALARRLDVEAWVHFTGWVEDDTISRVLSSADLGLQPDLPTPFTELCTMLKTIEYLAFGLPVVSFDLVETRRTAQHAAAYVTEPTAQAFGDQIAALLDDAPRRRTMSAHALRRARGELAWDVERPVYLDVVQRVLARAGAPAPGERTPTERTATGPDRLAVNS